MSQTSRGAVKAHMQNRTGWMGALQPPTSTPPPTGDFMDQGKPKPGRFRERVPDLHPPQHLLLITPKAEPLES